MTLTPLEVATLTAVVAVNDGATSEKISKRIRRDTGKTPNAKDLHALLCGMVERDLLSAYTVAALVPAYSVTPAGLAALDG